MATAQATATVNDKREIFGWAMYDWANSAFSTTVVVAFLGPYLTAITKSVADAEGNIHLLNYPIRFDSYFTFLISASVLLQVTFLPSWVPWPIIHTCASSSCDYLHSSEP